jgi:hypothetical protein
MSCKPGTASHRRTTYSTASFERRSAWLPKAVCGSTMRVLLRASKALSRSRAATRTQRATALPRVSEAMACLSITCLTDSICAFDRLKVIMSFPGNPKPDVAARHRAWTLSQILAKGGRETFRGAHAPSPATSLNLLHFLGILGMPSARAPMATREGACAPRSENVRSLREDQGRCWRLDIGLAGFNLSPTES